LDLGRTIQFTVGYNPPSRYSFWLLQQLKQICQQGAGKGKGTVLGVEKGIPTRRERGKSERMTKKQSWKG